VLETLRWIFAASLLTCLISIAIRRRRIVPAFTLYLLAAGIQTALHFKNVDPNSAWWLQWSMPVTALRCLAAIEVFWIRCPLRYTVRLAWIAGIAALCAGTTMASAQLRPGPWWMQTAQAFRHAETAMLAFLLFSIAASRLEWGKPSTWISRHSWLMVALVASHLAALIAYERADAGDWYLLLGISYAAGIAYFLGWTAATWPLGGKRAEAPSYRPSFLGTGQSH